MDGGTTAWNALSSEILRHVASYLSGKSLSSLAGCSTETLLLVKAVAIDRIHSLTSRLLTSNATGVVAWVNETREQMSDNFSVLLALSDFGETLGYEPNYVSWPVWIGTITLRDFNQERVSARIQIFIPIRDQSPCCYPPAWSWVLRHRNPSCLFQQETMNITPMAPFGMIRGVGPNDEAKVKRMKEVLERHSSVGVPIVHQEDTLDVRILPRREALERHARGMQFRQQHGNHDFVREVLSGSDADLFCFWQDDQLEDPSGGSYVDYMVAQMRIRARYTASR